MEPSSQRLSKGPLLLALPLVGLALILRSGLLLIVAGLYGLTACVVTLWGQYALRRMTYSRTLDRSHCFTGETVKLTVELANRKLLPVTHLTADDTFPAELEIKSRKLTYARIGKTTLRLIFGLASYQKVIRTYDLTATRRGYYQIGPAVLQGGDPFGYVQQQMVVEQKETLIVYPTVLPLERVGLPSQRPFGDLRSKDRLFEDPMRFAGVREYHPGDPFNRVHWKASAAAGSLQVRLLDPSANSGLAIFLNTWGFDHGWQGYKADVMETGCTVAASIVNWAWEGGLPVGLFANGVAIGWSQDLRLPPNRGPQVLPQALEGLARLHSPSREPVAMLLAQEAPRLSYGTSVVVITEQVSDDLAAGMFRVARSGRPVTLIRIGSDTDPMPVLPGIRVYDLTGEGALHAAVLA